MKLIQKIFITLLITVPFVLNAQDYKFTPAKNADGMLNNLEKFYEKVFSKAETWDELESYDKDMESLEKEIGIYESKLTEKQRKRFDMLLVKMNNKKNEFRENTFAIRDSYETNNTVSGLVTDENGFIYGPADNADEFLNNLEKFYNDVIRYVDTPDFEDLYLNDIAVLSFDVDRYENELTKKQQERFAKIKTMIEDKKKELRFDVTSAYEDSDIEVALICSFCVSSSENLIEEMEKFYNEVFVNLKDTEEALDYVNEMQELQFAINKYRPELTEKQKQEFKDLEVKYSVKALEIGLIVYPQSFEDE